MFHLPRTGATFDVHMNYVFTTPNMALVDLAKDKSQIMSVCGVWFVNAWML